MTDTTKNDEPTTPTREQIAVVLDAWGQRREQGKDSIGCRPEPPHIEDMAPGTTFTEEVRWTVTGTLSTGVVVAQSKDGMRFADKFDPSTIRDVTPPPALPNQEDA